MFTFLLKYNAGIDSIQFSAASDAEKMSSNFIGRNVMKATANR